MTFAQKVYRGTSSYQSDILFIYRDNKGTVGNVLGSMFNYFIGRIGNIEQISRWMHIKERRLRKTRDYVEKKGSWIAAFSFLPIMAWGK